MTALVPPMLPTSSAAPRLPAEVGAIAVGQATAQEHLLPISVQDQVASNAAPLLPPDSASTTIQPFRLLVPVSRLQLAAQRRLSQHFPGESGKFTALATAHALATRITAAAKRQI